MKLFLFWTAIQMKFVAVASLNEIKSFVAVKHEACWNTINKAGMTDGRLGAPPPEGVCVCVWLNVGTMLLRCIVEARLLNKYLALELSNFIII